MKMQPPEGKTNGNRKNSILHLQKNSYNCISKKVVLNQPWTCAARAAFPLP
jgi:hypothetical protein